MGNYDLAYVIKAIDEFSPTMKKMQEAITNFEKQTEKTEDRFKKFSDTMRTVGKNLYRYITLPLVGAAIYALKNANNFDVMRIKLEAVAGSAANAAKIMDYIKETAMATGLSPESLTTVAKKLFAAGYGMDQINDKMRQMAVLAIGSGQEIESLASIITRMASRKTTSGFLLTRLTNLGIPIIPAFQKFWGIDDAKMMLLLRKPLNFKKLVEPVLDSMTKKGSDFAESYDKMLKTQGRSLERMHIFLRYIADDFGEALNRVFGIKDGLSGTADKLKIVEEKLNAFLRNNPELFKMGVYFAILLAILAPIALGLSMIRTIIMGVTSAVTFLNSAAVMTAAPWITALTVIYTLYKSIIGLKTIAETGGIEWGKAFSQMGDLYKLAREQGVGVAGKALWGGIMAAPYYQHQVNVVGSGTFNLNQGGKTVATTTIPLNTGSSTMATAY